jgi:hypothetical protein
MVTVMRTAASENLPRRKLTQTCPQTLLSSDAAYFDEFRILWRSKDTQTLLRNHVMRAFSPTPNPHVRTQGYCPVSHGKDFGMYVPRH